MRSWAKFWLFTLAVATSAAADVPKLDRPVVDLAGVLSDATVQKLERFLRAIHDRKGPQISLLTVPNLDGEPIESYSIKVVEKTRLGTAKQDNGVLLLLALRERKVRIEVGQGLEGVLTDAHSRRIIDNGMVPFLRRGRYDEAMEEGVLGIVERVYPEALNGELAPVHRESQGEVRDFFIIFIIVMIFIFLKVFMFSGGRYWRRSTWDSFGNGGFGGYGGGFGGGGGGGSSGSWGGGGGGFSGGGASGNW